MLLIHQPFNDCYGSYRAMEEAYRAGYVRAIGVSDFYQNRLIDLCQFVEVKPAINQVETHVFRQQAKALDEGESLFFSHYDPDMVEFLTGLGK